MIKNEYIFNNKFRQYVDECCSSENITVGQALMREDVKAEFHRCTDV